MRSKKILTMFMAPLFAVGLTACDVDQTEEGQTPDVEVEEGELPAYDVQGPDVEVTEDTVTVPDVNVDEPQGAGDDGATGDMRNEDGMTDTGGNR